MAVLASLVFIDAPLTPPARDCSFTEYAPWRVGGFSLCRSEGRFCRAIVNGQGASNMRHCHREVTWSARRSCLVAAIADDEKRRVAVLSSRGDEIALDLGPLHGQRARRERAASVELPAVVLDEEHFPAVGLAVEAQFHPHEALVAGAL